MTITTTTKTFIDNLIEYYINEASSYKQLAHEYASESENVSDVTFGIIIGCIYSGFLQVYTNQKQKPNLSEIQEFHHIIKRRIEQIKKAVADAKV